MVWKVEHLLTATDEELLAYAHQKSPTLRRMHAIDQLCKRSLTNRSLLDAAVESVVASLGHSDRLGGLPVGYLGAAKLHEHGGDVWKSLLAALVRVSDLEREDLLRWLNPVPADDASATVLPDIDEERELVFVASLEASAIAEAISSALDHSTLARVEVIVSADGSCTIGFVTLKLTCWEELEKRRGCLSKALGATTCWDFPEQYGELGPNVRVAVHPDQTETLVKVIPTADGYTVKPFHL
jgi:hypothetical protein